MDSYLLEILNETTEYIETHLLEPLSLDSISENVNLSKFHLLRIWKGATNTGLMEYVRKRRIALSLADLINHRNSIEFISSKYSFGCERTYNRAFKEEYHITPAKWRKKPCRLQILDRFNADFLYIAGKGLVFLRSITVLPHFSIAGHEYVIDSWENMNRQTANQLGVAFFYNDRHRIINPVNKNIYIGFTTIKDSTERHMLYQPSLEVNLHSIIPPDMNVREVTPHKYGVFTYIGPHAPEEISSKTLKPIWKHVHEIWIPTVQFNLKEKFSFEHIDYSRCSKHYCECDLYYPISYL